MNIFILDKDPKKAAEYHNNKHVVKMILETCQLLVTPYYTLNCISNRTQAQDYRKVLTEKYSSFPRLRFYGFGYYSHPCARWVQYSEKNWQWLLSLGFALCAEYTKRYDKVHACEEVLNWFCKNPPTGKKENFMFWHTRPLTVPANATTIKDKFESFPTWDDAVDTYRQYYETDKLKLAQWKTKVPEWFQFPINNDAINL